MVCVCWAQLRWENRSEHPTHCKKREPWWGGGTDNSWQVLRVDDVLRTDWVSDSRSGISGFHPRENILLGDWTVTVEKIDATSFLVHWMQCIGLFCSLWISMSRQLFSVKPQRERNGSNMEVNVCTCVPIKLVGSSLSSPKLNQQPHVGKLGRY